MLHVDVVVCKIFKTLINFIYFRERFPKIHPLFPERPTMMCGRLVRSFVEVGGAKRWISPEIEDFLASGANFSHSGAAVHQTALEYLLWIADKWAKSVAYLWSQPNSPITPVRYSSLYDCL